MGAGVTAVCLAIKNKKKSAPEVPYDATIYLDDTGKYVNYKLEFAPRKKKK